MADTRPVLLDQPPKKPANHGKWRDRWDVLRDRSKVVAAKSVLFVADRKNLRVTSTQVFGAALALVGIALIWSAPWALLVGGVGVVIAAERQ